nr:MAG TPA: hypothetical protein [Crassvirales sp.]
MYSSSIIIKTILSCILYITILILNYNINYNSIISFIL